MNILFLREEKQQEALPVSQLPDIILCENEYNINGISVQAFSQKLKVGGPRSMFLAIFLKE